MKFDLKRETEDHPHDGSLMYGLSSGVDEKNRILYLVGEIDEMQVYRFLMGIAQLDTIPDKEIRVVISSSGGTEHCGYAIYDALKNTKNTVIAEGYGMVGSIAAIIFQGADLRYVSKNCEYMIHNGSIEGTPDQIEQDKILELADLIKTSNKKYYQILMDNSSLTLDEIQEYCSEEKYFSSDECIKYGLADAILKPCKKQIKKRKKGKK